jgi:hypothetical protein
MLVPKEVEVLAPRCKRCSRILREEFQKLAILTFRVCGSVLGPLIALRTLFSDGCEIKTTDHRELLVSISTDLRPGHGSR